MKEVTGGERLVKVVVDIVVKVMKEMRLMVMGISGCEGERR